MTRVTARTLEIASAALSSDLPDSEIAAQYGVSRERVRAIRRAAGDGARATGRRRSDAVTPASARGRALLAQLVADAAEARVGPEEYLHDARNQRGATDRIVELLSDAHHAGALTELERDVWRIAIGPVDSATTEATRRVVEILEEVKT